MCAYSSHKNSFQSAFSPSHSGCRSSLALIHSHFPSPFLSIILVQQLVALCFSNDLLPAAFPPPHVPSQLLTVYTTHELVTAKAAVTACDLSICFHNPILLPLVLSLRYKTCLLLLLLSPPLPHAIPRPSLFVLLLLRLLGSSFTRRHIYSCLGACMHICSCRWWMRALFSIELRTQRAQPLGGILFRLGAYT